MKNKKIDTILVDKNRIAFGSPQEFDLHINEKSSLHCVMHIYTYDYLFKLNPKYIGITAIKKI